MANIAVRLLARGEGWTVQDVICTAGPQDRPFEERHSCVTIAIVAAGSFEYRSEGSRELMTPGSLLLGNKNRVFECAHEHAAGDRCISFGYSPDYFERLTKSVFRCHRVPPVRALSPLVSRVCAAVRHSDDVSWEEISIRLAAQAIHLTGQRMADRSDPPPSAVGRVTRIVRAIERHAEARLPLGTLARAAGLSPYHFLRTFERVTGVTPHQYVRRARLREAAMRLSNGRAKVIEVALDCGFGDVSNFNRAFRAEFGVNPRAYRASAPSTIRG